MHTKSWPAGSAVAADAEGAMTGLMSPFASNRRAGEPRAGERLAAAGRSTVVPMRASHVAALRRVLLEWLDAADAADAQAYYDLMADDPGTWNQVGQRDA